MRMTRRLTLSVGAALLSLLGPAAFAQGEISGRVTTSDSTRVAVTGAEAVIARLQRTTVTDSLGRFRFNGLPAGRHVVVIRAIGFEAESSTVEIERDEVLSLDVRLDRSGATTLPERVVKAPEARVPAHLVEFNERRTAGVGHFLSREQLEKAEGGRRQTGDLISVLPGVMARRGTNKVWIASGRTRRTGNCAFCAGTVDNLLPSDVAAGARPACFMDVYINGALVFDSRDPKVGLFDVNSVPPEHIAGIEVYTSTAQIPAKYNRTGGDCGVLLIWTR
jgi:hypothetical protein